MKFWFQVLALTGLLLAGYVGLLRVTGLRARYAEANVVVNEIKWQRFEQHRDAGLVVIGSSIAGRLPADSLAGPGRTGVNLALDGCSAAFGAELLRDAGVAPPWLMIEANTLTLPPSQNERTLRAGFHSFKNTLARQWPFLRAENRPVTVAYSRLKQRSDERVAGRGQGVHPTLDAMALQRSRAAVAVSAVADPALAAAWLATVKHFQERGSRVALVMLPDGGNDRAAAYAVAQSVAVAAGVPFYDLKGALPEAAWGYSDGIHLVAPAARALAAWLAPELSPAPPNPASSAAR